MQKMNLSSTVLTSRVRLAALTLASGALLLTGCGVDLRHTASTASTGANFSGSVHGGQQPVSGATMQLYAASTAGYGASSYPLLTTTVLTDSGGNFSITGDYTCPSSSAQVYLVATGGNPGAASVNPNLALMTSLGVCGNLTPATFISVNELTTVAAAYALSPFMANYTSVGTSATNVVGFTNAVANVGRLVNSGTGALPTTITGVTIPVNKLNTLADILAACVNSTGGVAGDSTMCGSLFSAATPPGGIAPTDTIAAALNIAHFPGNNTTALFNLSSASGPFQPTMTAASDFTLAIKYTNGSLSTPSASAVDPNGNVWVTNSASNTVSVFAPSGQPVSGSPFIGGGLSGPSGVAIDATGNAWITDKTSSKLSVFTPAGVGTQTAAAGFSTPSAVAIDGQGIIFVTNSGSNSVTAVMASGTAVTSSSSYTGAGIGAPVAVAINPR